MCTYTDHLNDILFFISFVRTACSLNTPARMRYGFRSNKIGPRARGRRDVVFSFFFFFYVSSPSNVLRTDTFAGPRRAPDRSRPYDGCCCAPCRSSYPSLARLPPRERSAPASRGNVPGAPYRYIDEY